MIGALFGCSTTMLIQSLNKKINIQPNTIYTGKEFTKINNYNYYRISPKFLHHNMSEKEFYYISKGYFKFYRKDFFTEFIFPNLDYDNEEVHQINISEDIEKIAVGADFSITVNGGNKTFIIKDPIRELLT